MGRGWIIPSLWDPHLGVFAELSLVLAVNFATSVALRPQALKHRQGLGFPLQLHRWLTFPPKNPPGAHPHLLSPSHVCLSKAPLIFKSLHKPSLSSTEQCTDTHRAVDNTGAGAVREKPLNFFLKGQEMGKKKNPGPQERHRCCCCGHWAGLCSGCKGRHFQGAPAVKAVPGLPGFALPCPFPPACFSPALCPEALPGWHSPGWLVALVALAAPGPSWGRGDQSPARLHWQMLW